MKKITIKDIAKYCEVSITTVSWVLNGKTKELSEETVEKVQDAVEELGYARNEVARSLVTSRSKTIAFIIPDITNLFYASIIKAANKIAAKSGYNILLCNTDNSLQEEMIQIKLLDNRLIDGVIIASRNAKKLLKKFENNRSVPIVVIDEDIEIDNKNTMIVNTDNKEAATIITDHILSKNHKNIFILGGLKDSTNTKKRYQGVLESVKAHGLNENNIMIKYADFQMDNAYLLTSKHFQKKYTAILAFNDLMAYGAIKALNNMELKNVSVAGFDANTTLNLFNEITEFDLTSINQNEKMIGEIATTLILEKFSKNIPTRNEPVHIQANLHRGNTVLQNK